MEMTAAQDPTGNVKATRADWLTAARDLLVAEGVEQVKVMTIGRRLGVSRSSFYWYFQSRQALLDALLREWEATNTGGIVAQCSRPAATITEAVCNLFRCFVDDGIFNARLDSAVRAWSRRAEPVRRVVDRSDAARLDAIQTMYRRHGFSPDEAAIRARILYFMQIGYYALEMNEPLEERLARVPGYLLGFTGQPPRGEEVAAFRAFARSRSRSGPDTD